MQQDFQAWLVGTAGVRVRTSVNMQQQIFKSSSTLLGSGHVGHARPRKLVCRAQQGSNNERNNYNVRKGKQFENARRRRGRPAHLRSPYDSPLRDGNRDRLIGLLTERAAKTLMVYLMETNANVYSWLVEFYKKHPIPRNGSWDEVSGEAFLRKLLSMPIEEAKYNTGRDSLFDNVRSCGVDPRSIAQRIMDIRTQLSEEFIQELQAIAEENSLLLRETLQTSLSTSITTTDEATSSSSGTPTHPELTSSSASSTSSSTTKSDSGSSSSNGNKSGSVTTPPPSPAPAAASSKPEPIKGSSSASSSSSSKNAKTDADAAGKAAAIAALNAALKASSAAGSGSSSSSGSHPELTPTAGSSEDEKVDMVDVLAQLRRAMEADVARDVLKMKETTAAEADSSKSDTPAAPAAEEPSPAAPAAASAAADAAGADESLQPAAELEQELTSEAPVATGAVAAEDITAGSEAADSSGEEDAGSPGSISTQLSSSAVGEAGTYSRMLPKGWGPRLGVGFSRYPRSRNNIVSSANLGVSKTAGAGDAMSASSTAGEAV